MTGCSVRLLGGFSWRLDDLQPGQIRNINCFWTPKKFTVISIHFGSRSGSGCI